MSTFKKIVSIMLCIAMLAGSFTMLGGLATPDASAADGESKIDSYADLDAKYDSFIYLGSEVYEVETADGTLNTAVDEDSAVLTDYYVEAGQILEERFYIKGDFYFGNSQIVNLYDNTFFEVKQITTAAPDSTGYSTGYTGIVNEAHPVYVDYNIQSSVTSAAGTSVSWLTKNAGYTEEQLKTLDLVQSVLSNPGTGTKKNNAFVFQSDEWLFSWVYQVKEGLADGITGTKYTSAELWNCNNGDGSTRESTWGGRKGSFSIAAGPVSGDVLASTTKTSFVNYSLIKAFLFEDLVHTFTIGANPDDNQGGGESSGPVAGESKIDSYADLDAKYESFIYLGSEVYEVETEDGTLNTAVDEDSAILTDYYVEAGQILEERFYIKGDFYFGNSQIVNLYDNTFFEVKQITTAAPDSTGYSTGYTGIVNEAHPVYVDYSIQSSVTSAAGTSVSWLTKNAGYTEEQLKTLDLVQSVLSNPGTGTKKNNAFVFQSDEWLFSWVYQVKEGLADGITGTKYTSAELWNCNNGDGSTRESTWGGRKGSFSIAAGPVSGDVLASTTKTSFVNYSLIKAFLFEDLVHTFTIGANPNAGGTTPVKKYTVTFLENDGTEISAEEYVKDAAVVVPEAVDGQIGWANTATGAIADLTDYVAVRNAEFKRVLDTDEFDVVLAVDGGEVDAEALPEGATVNEDGDIIVSANFNEEINLNEAIPVPVKEGYTGTWSPETITIDNINGEKATVVWTANTYKASFYTNKGDAEAALVADATYNQNLKASIAAPEGYRFAGWVDADTDEAVLTVGVTKDTFKYTYAGDKSFYAVWTAYDSSITFMIRDYANGSGWKEAAVKYNDNGAILTAKDSTAVLTAIEADNGVKVSRTPAGKAYVYSDEALKTYVDTTSDVIYDGQEETDIDGNKVYNKVLYVATELVFDITWKVPVYENGEPTGEYTETTSTVKTSMSGETGVYSTFAKTNADTTAPAGFSFKGWIDETTGEAVEYTNNGIVLDGNSARTLVYVADFQETEYTIKFVVNRDKKSSDIITLSQGVKVGEAIDPSIGTLTNLEGTEVELPVIGKENSELANPFRNNYGFKFTGWKLGTGANATDVAISDVLTTEMVEDYAIGESVSLYAQWEALEYDLRFFYATSDADMSLPVEERTYADPIIVTYKTEDTISLQLQGDNLALVTDNTPEGYVYQSFGPLDNSVVNKMPAYGLDVYARYIPQNILIYVDYNNNKTDENDNPLPLKDTLALSSLLTQNPVVYGDDLERAEDIENGITMGVGTLIMRSIITEGNRPGDNYEVVSWNVYHVEEGADIYDKANWKPGANDEGSTIAKSTIIYQPEWKHHSEFFFRVYGTDGKIYMALGKNFKLYYWNNNYVCKRGDTTVNKDKENTVILLYTIAFETEGGLTMRLDPVFAPKSMFTIEAMIALFKALGNLIKGLF